MKINDIVEEMRKWFITKDIFELRIDALENQITPLQRIIYGFIGLLLVAVGTFFVNMVIKKPL